MIPTAERSHFIRTRTLLLSKLGQVVVCHTKYFWSRRYSAVDLNIYITQLGFSLRQSQVNPTQSGTRDDASYIGRVNRD